MSSKRPNLVLLTATVVVPADARKLARRDTAQRLQDYLQAVDFYLSQLARGSFDMPVFCENSGYDLAPFHASVLAAGVMAGKRLRNPRGCHHSRRVPARTGIPPCAGQRRWRRRAACA